MDKALVGLVSVLFFIGCAYAGWYAGRNFPWWIVLFFFSLAALVLLDRRR